MIIAHLCMIEVCWWYWDDYRWSLHIGVWLKCVDDIEMTW